jgi:hypothetical protein
MHDMNLLIFIQFLRFERKKETKTMSYEEIIQKNNESIEKLAACNETLIDKTSLETFHNDIKDVLSDKKVNLKLEPELTIFTRNSTQYIDKFTDKSYEINDLENKIDEQVCDYCSIIELAGINTILKNIHVNESFLNALEKLFKSYENLNITTKSINSLKQKKLSNNKDDEKILKKIKNLQKKLISKPNPFKIDDSNYLLWEALCKELKTTLKLDQV